MMLSRVMCHKHVFLVTLFTCASCSNYQIGVACPLHRQQNHMTMQGATDCSEYIFKQPIMAFKSIRVVWCTAGGGVSPQRVILK